ncbi:hypothetical protein [Aneurinibacillus aneurinilyticus]|uniref:Uncharacterized protein n=1 Tax=Aneurinibacillus aneurinilyticus ATCC 12856 TaxID=649747 RepID=U1WUW7_ANEAE|nr:hypothetical protein [Aneurinibacillus aneurinilyticus]ERI06475.1 hypothetical protein HMPREF0083_05317 [Aneurinibacillus aneurinilyticus ATCC 12856]MED0670632.1 hypothetical protein [Aneurinibacillus aneurinilyticus]MED0707090.1 hypothetical protein [Aneurinibacillus aneurinilyticus]MED0732841.1 hypothetical protein [Aneurinibacillus aneurinilyticus]MED0740389.1 hypothetical protein [Aneurinibacillus aneurinilyticus]
MSLADKVKSICESGELTHDFVIGLAEEMDGIARVAKIGLESDSAFHKWCALKSIYDAVIQHE